MHQFKLSDEFVNEYSTKDIPWGPMGEFTYLRTYSRIKEDGSKERWHDTVRRVVEGTFTTQKNHCENLKLVWNNAKAQKSAKIMYDKIFNFKFLPPGRGLWMMGTPFVDQKGSASLNNCGFISTEDIQTRGSFAFTWTMDALMLGVGIGFDTKGASKLTIHQPKKDGTFIIPDSREGWVESLSHILDAFFYGRGLPIMDYSLVRPYGTPIKGFGGVASGPEPLRILHESAVKLLTQRIGQKIKSTDIVDIMNMIGKCVVAGNVRRSAEIAIGEWTDKEYVTMKDYNLHPEELQSHRWASNNSIFAEVGKTRYEDFAQSIALNGEPGIVWLENIREFSRAGVSDWKDKSAVGVNPCLVGNTIIQTTKGRITIQEMTERYADGEQFDVYSMNKKGELEIKPAYNIVKTKEAEQLVYITLSNGSHIECTPEHLIFVLDTSGNIIEVEAKNIDKKLHTPIVLQRIRKSEAYLRVKLNTQTKYIPEHRFVASAYTDIDGMDVHHKNGKTYDNSVENLEVMLHGEHSIESNKGHVDWSERDLDGTFLRKQEKKSKELANIPDDYLTKNGFGGQVKFTSVQIRDVGFEPVYDMTVVDNHNFIANNIVVHNCAEQSLESGELCCLVETFPAIHNSIEEYIDTLKYAYMYAKTVTLIPTHWPETNAILLKNRRIGLSQSGIVDAFAKFSRHTIVEVWNNKAYDAVQDYDQVYSDWFCVPRSKKTTSIKPSGSVSLLPGVSPGIHYPHAEYYIRRIRVATESPLVKAMKDAGYQIEFEVYGDEEERKKTSVVHFPVHEKNFTKKKEDVSIWEQVKNAVDYQRTWADNSVSITVTFNKNEAKDIPSVLYAFEKDLKTISFLPIAEHGYDMAPYEEITKEKYEEMVSKITGKPDFSEFLGGPAGSKFCDGDSCEPVFEAKKETKTFSFNTLT